MADELINLVEYAQGLNNPLASGLIEQLPATSDVLETMRFKAVSGGIHPFDRETADPTVGFRGVNEEPEISYGAQERFQDAVYPISGLLEYDRVKLNRHGPQRMALDLEGQMKNAARLWTTTFIDGDNDSDPKEFHGMKARLKAVGGSVDGTNEDSRLLANSTSSGGAALSLANLDKAIDLVNEPSHILMSRDMKVKFGAAARDPNLTNNRVSNDMDSDLGRRVMRFGDIPILTGYQVAKGTSFLPYNEVAHGGGSANTTSIYVVSFRENGVCGIHTQPPEVDEGTTDKLVHQRRLFEWDCGITIEDYYSAIRLSSITNAAIAA